MLNGSLYFGAKKYISNDYNNVSVLYFITGFFVYDFWEYTAYFA